MRLEGVTAELRPRTDWEAVDLGLALVRRDFWSLGLTWWLGMSPLLLPALLLLPGHPFWFLLLFWWWIPVASRLVLFKLSRRLFGEAPGWRAVFRELPGAMTRRFWHRMLLARFSPRRPLSMAVEDLEGLRGKEYRERCKVLTSRGDSSLVLVTVWRLFLAFWMAVAIFFTAALFVPEGAGEGWSEAMSLWWEGEAGDPPTSLSLMLTASMCGSLWLVDLFSIGAGFGIYVNHRTWIEGWDVELAFRRLGNRLRGLAAIAIVVGSLLLTGRSEAEEAEEVIGRVLEHGDFEVHHETVRTPKGDWGDGINIGGGGGAALETFGLVVKIGAIGGVLALILWLIWRYRHVFIVRRGSARQAVATARADMVMGMAVKPSSLPDDVATVALAMWREGRRHEAVSLLYRGAISWMIHRGGVEIAESDTESDCLGRIRAAAADHGGYFETLSSTWTRLAYARVDPGDAEIEALCEAWPFGERGRS